MAARGLDHDELEEHLYETICKLLFQPREEQEAILAERRRVFYASNYNGKLFKDPWYSLYLPNRLTLIPYEQLLDMSEDEWVSRYRAYMGTIPDGEAMFKSSREWWLLALTQHYNQQLPLEQRLFSSLPYPQVFEVEGNEGVFKVPRQFDIVSYIRAPPHAKTITLGAHDPQTTRDEQGRLICAQELPLIAFCIDPLIITGLKKGDKVEVCFRWIPCRVMRQLVSEDQPNGTWLFIDTEGLDYKAYWKRNRKVVNMLLNGLCVPEATLQSYCRECQEDIGEECDEIECPTCDAPLYEIPRRVLMLWRHYKKVSVERSRNWTGKLLCLYGHCDLDRDHDTLVRYCGETVLDSEEFLKMRFYASMRTMGERRAEYDRLMRSGHTPTGPMQSLKWYMDDFCAYTDARHTYSAGLPVYTLFNPRR